jgi:hypothetical protein
MSISLKDLGIVSEPALAELLGIQTITLSNKRNQRHPSGIGALAIREGGSAFYRIDDLRKHFAGLKTVGEEKSEAVVPKGPVWGLL